MNSKKVGSSSISGTNNPLYRPPGGGAPKNGVPTSPAKPWTIADYDFSGEPQGLSDDTNLGTTCEREDTSQTKSKSKSAPSQLQFDSESSVDDGSREADTASEESEPVTPPANTPPGPAQPTVQFSEDPAIAALQKSTLAATTQVVLYATCLAILDNALADPQCKLPPNSFSYLRGLFGGAIKECEARAQELTHETEQLLAQHSQEAKALASLADGDASPAADDTFSVRSSRAAPVNLRRALREVKQLPTQAQQDQIIEGLRAALEKVGPVSKADLDRELLQIQWDLDNPHLKGVDAELGEFHKQLQENETEPITENFDAEVKALQQQGKELDELQYSVDSDVVDKLLDHDSTSSANSENKSVTLDVTENMSASTASTEKSPSQLDGELLALLAELENQTKSASTKPQLQQPTKTPLSTSAQLQELIQNHSTLTADELQYVNIETTQFQNSLASEEGRPLTEHESAERVLYENQQPEPYRQYLKNKLIDDYLAKQRAIIADSERGIALMLDNQDGSGEVENARQQRIDALLSARRVAVSLTLTVGPLKA